MNAPAHLRKGWCPGALRPMQTGDGLLVRIRPRAGTLSIEGLIALAAAAAAFGSGEIDLTNRANLQIRGVLDTALCGLQTVLDCAGLLDPTAEEEAVRNVVTDALSGVDPRLPDVRPIAVDLERRLQNEPVYSGLPNKFGFAVGAQSANHGFRAKTDIAIYILSNGRAALELDGDPQVYSLPLSASPVDAALAITRAHLDICGVQTSRLHETVAALGAADLMKRASIDAVPLSEPKSPAPLSCIGELSLNNKPFGVGIALPFGRVRAEQLTALAEHACSLGVKDVRVSHTRTLVFPVQTEAASASLAALAQDLGLIVSSSDPRRQLDACPGMPACPNATTHTRADAEALVSAFTSAGMTMPTLHVSGCEKGCARQSPAQLTLIAKDGAYSLVLDGTVSNSSMASNIAPSQLGETARSILTRRAS